MKLIKPNHFLFSILMLVAALLFLAGCGEGGKNQNAASLQPDGSFSTAIPFQLEKIPDGSTLTANLVIDGGPPIAMTVNGDNVSVTTPELEAGSHSFIITYFLDEKRIASVSTNATIISGRSTVITFDISQLDQDLDQDGFTGIDEVIAGSDPDNAVSTPPETNTPTAKISFPPPVSLTDATQITIRGTATDETGVSAVLVNGIAATSKNGFENWQAVVPLNRGKNTLIVEVRDTFGNINLNAANVSTSSNPVTFVSPERVVLDASNNRALVTDRSLGALIAVDLATGNRSILSSQNVGSGPAFTAPDNVTLDVTNNRVLVLDGNLDLLIAVNLTTGNRLTLSSPLLGTGPTFSIPEGAILDSANNRVLVIDEFIVDALIAVDLSTGNRTILSDAITGTGIAFSSPHDVALDTVNNRALVTDQNLDALIAVDLGTGNRSILSNASTGTGIPFSFPTGISLDSANNRVLVMDGTTLISADLVTGNRTTLSSSFVGNGPDLVSPLGITLDATNNRVLVVDNGLNAVIAVDLSTGDRAILSDASSLIGDGPALSFPKGMTLDAANQRVLMVSDGSDALIEVDLNTGNRTILSGGSPLVGSGAAFSSPQGVTLDEVNKRALMVDGILKTLVAVDLSTGNRTIFSGGSPPVGAGPAFNFPLSATLDVANQRVFVGDPNQKALITVDLTTGNRTIFSGGTPLIGAGTALSFPNGVTLDVANSRALVVDPNLSALVTVDLATGNRSILSSSSSGLGTGPAFSSPADVVLDVLNNRALVSDRNLRALIAVDLTTGNRSIFSGGSSLEGNGPAFVVPDGVTLDPLRKLVLVLDVTRRALIAVNLKNGERVIISR